MSMYFARFVLFCADAINDFMYKNCPYVAGAIAFYTLFSLFPLLLAVLSILGFVLGPEAQQEEFVEAIAEVVPVSSDLISNTLQGVVSARAITGATAFIGLIWASTAAFGAIRKGINYAWGIRRTRPFLRERAMDLGLVLGAAVIVMVMLFVSPVLGVVREITAAVAPGVLLQYDLLWTFVTNLIVPLVSFVIFLALYYVIPNTNVRIHDVWPTAVGVALAFWIVNMVFVWYVQTFPVHNALYGPVGAILALLTWVYISAITLLFGALLCSRYAGYVANYSDVRGVQGSGLWLILSSASRVRLRVIRDPAATFAD